MSKQKGLSVLKAVGERVAKLTGYDRTCMKNVEFISVENGNCTAEFTIGKEHLNAVGTMHGGCTCTLVDCVSSYALLSTESGRTGVSVDLHVSFLSPARAGDVVKIDVKTVKAGRTLAYQDIELARKSDGVVVARASHRKFVG